MEVDTEQVKTSRTPRADRARQRASSLWRTHGAGYYRTSYTGEYHAPTVAKCQTIRDLLRLCAMAEMEEMELRRSNPEARVTVVRGPAK